MTKEMPPFVSTIIATMAAPERAELVRRAVLSVRRGSELPVTIIVVVNGKRSDPELVDWLRRQPDVKLEIVAQPSLPNALLRGRELVRTPFFSTLDDDDEYLSDASTSQPTRGPKSKRNDPAAFATSISKMLSSKLPSSRRADPIVARSASAAEQARQAVDTALETKARRRLREQKRLAMEKGRVRDVLVASTTRTLNVATGEIEEVPDEEEGGMTTTGGILAGEKRLRKVAQRGVVKLFNAVRAAQVKATEAERAARREGVVGVKRKEEKVTEMSRKGFLDLIASGGGGLKKGGLEEA